jgi:hypothetical protein
VSNVLAAPAANVAALLVVAQAVLVERVARALVMAEVSLLVTVSAQARVRARGDLLALLAQVAQQRQAAHAPMRMVLAAASAPDPVQQDLPVQQVRGAHRADRVLAVIVQRVQDAQAVLVGLAVQDVLRVRVAQQGQQRVSVVERAAIPVAKPL